MKPLTCLLLFLLTLTLTGCAGGNWLSRRLGVGEPNHEALRAQGKEIEVQIFLGGYGLDFFQRTAREYERTHPGVKVILGGDPRIIDKLRPRLLAGNPPDVFWAFLPIVRLADGGALYCLDEDLETPAYGQPGVTWRQSFLPGPLATTMVRGKCYFIPTDLSVMLMWYNVGMFEKHGWQVPRTWDELYALCEQIKAAGVAPIAFQGRYADYASPMLLSYFQRKAGDGPLFDIINLKPKAWLHPDMLAAATMLQDMVKRGYFQPGCMGMTHTEAQMEFVNSRAAMVPCGTWLKAEQRDTIPPGFRMSSFNWPAVTGGKGDPTVTNVSLGYWCVPAKGVNIKGGVDFLKFLTSRETANAFAVKKDTLFAVAKADRGLAPELQPAVDTMNQARYTWAGMHTQWYPELGKRSSDYLAGLMSGNLTPQQFCDKMEAVCERVRQDKRTPKYTMPLPPGATP